MQIKRDGLFFKFLSLYDANTYNLDSCKVISIVIRNLIMTFFLLVLLPFMLLFVLVGMLYMPFSFAAGGLIIPGIIAAMICYGLPFIGWYLATKDDVEKSDEPSVASQLYDSWKNKYCLKVEVV